MGLQRVRAMCLSDAHIICTDEEQAVEEAGKALDLIEYLSSIFDLKVGVDYRYRLSMGDRTNQEKYPGNEAAWDKAEDLLRKLMQSRGVQFEEAKGEATFYGPKIDVQMKNVNGKEDTAFTVQYDFCMPDRFDLKYTGSDGKEHRAFVIHRSSVGTIERMMAFLIEKYAGAFPANRGIGATPHGCVSPSINDWFGTASTSIATRPFWRSCGACMPRAWILRRSGMIPSSIRERYRR